MSEYVDFHYMPLDGKITGEQVLKQTEDAINDLGNKVYSLDIDQSEIDEAIEKSNEAINTANSALSAVTTGRSVWFNNVAEMVATDIEAGVTAETKGYHVANDGGNALYLIRQEKSGDVVDGGSLIALDNGNMAELVTDGTVNVKQFGAIGNGTDDDTTVFQNTSAYAQAKGFVPFVGVATYKITSNVTGTFNSFGDVTITGGGTVDIINLQEVVSDVSDIRDEVVDETASAKAYSESAATSATNASNSASSAQETATALTDIYNEAISSGQIVAPAVDPNLTISGAAADARRVGIVSADNVVAEYVKSNLVDCTDFGSANCKYVTDDSFETIVATGETSLWAQTSCVANNHYTLSLRGLSVSGDANLRMYLSDKSTFIRELSADGDLNFTGYGGEYVRIYLTNGASVRVDKLRIVDRVTGVATALEKAVSSDYIDYETIKEQIKTKTETTITLESGSLNGDGSEKASALFMRSGYFPIKKGFTYHNERNFTFFYAEYNSEYVNTKNLSGSLVPSFVASADGYARVVIGLDYTFTTMFGESQYTSDMVQMYDIVREGLIDNTYIETINSVQRVVNDTLVTEVQTGCNASLYGVLPSNTGAENSTALQALLDNSGTIIIDVPGTYDFADTLVIHSNTKLIFGANVYCRRTTSSNGFMINAGALTRTYDTDIIIDGLHLICNNIGGSTNGLVYGLRGHVGFFYVKNLQIRNFRCDDFPADCYLLHLAKFDGVVIDGYYASGLKDGIHCSSGKNLHIIHGIFQTKDDPVALNAFDYPTGCPCLGWIENVVVEDCIDLSGSNNTVFFSRLLPGSWSAWQSGNSYQNGDAVVSTNGKVYRVTMTVSTQTYVSTVAPSVASGSETTADGITWRYVQDETIYNCGVKNITFRNIYVNQNKSTFTMLQKDSDGYSRCYYPGSTPPISRNIILDNVFMDNKMSYLFLAKMPFTDVKIQNCQIWADNIVTTSQPGSQQMESHVILFGNTYRNEIGEAIQLVRLFDTSVAVKLYKSCNINVNGVAENISAGVTVVS